MKKVVFRLLFCLCLLIGIATTDALRNLRSQQHALSEMFYDPATLQRKAGLADGNNLWDASAVVSAKKYPQDGLKEKDKISKLPGQPGDAKFDQYAGYVTVDGDTGRALFYYFAESDGSAASSNPLLLWLNGGPGCSSLGYGAMEELGPFRVMSDGKTLYKNPYAWNNVANMLFLESPAGVGFSYSNTTADYEESGDKRTAEDAYVFLVNWFERFPEYKGRDFYLAGESYAGHYVPQLAHAILQHKANMSTINLKGIMIGNAVINDETDTQGMYDYFWTHALISDEAINGINRYCDFSPNATGNNILCQQALGIANAPFNLLDIYDIYAPLCFSSNLTDTPKKPSSESVDPCIDIYVNAYLNDPAVQEALHANFTKLNYTWSACSGVLPVWRDSPSTILPILKELVANKIRVLVFSGDIDGRVPVTSTRYSLSELHLPIITDWYAWTVNNEVGGFSFVYTGNLTFATVRGAGHQVPSYQGLRALVLVNSFLEGKPLPS